MDEARAEILTYNAAARIDGTWATSCTPTPPATASQATEGTQVMAVIGIDSHKDTLAGVPRQRWRRGRRAPQHRR